MSLSGNTQHFPMWVGGVVGWLVYSYIGLKLNHVRKIGPWNMRWDYWLIYGSENIPAKLRLTGYPLDKMASVSQIITLSAVL